MQLVKKFNHPVHQVNYYRAIIKRALQAYEPKSAEPIIVPDLCRDLDYYFVFETAPKRKLNILVYGLTCFDSDGIILFNYQGIYPVSLWRFERQGAVRSVQMMEGVVKQVFRRKNIPLESDEPFAPFQQGIFVCSINWSAYNRLKVQPYAI